MSRPRLLAAALVWGVARGARSSGLRAGEWRYPAGAAEFLRSHNVTAPIFNTYFIGGYLIWKGQSTFIDGRALSETVFKDYRTIIDSPPGAPERRALLARYGAGAIVMDSYEYLTGAMHGLVRAMAYPDMAEWKLAYEDPQSMVFLRDLPAGVPEIPEGPHCRPPGKRVPQPGGARSEVSRLRLEAGVPGGAEQSAAGGADVRAVLRPWRQQRGRAPHVSGTAAVGSPVRVDRLS